MFKQLEEAAGHKLTHCGMIWAGTHLYYCERCAGVAIFRQGSLAAFHTPPGGDSTPEECVLLFTGVENRPEDFLKAKLGALSSADWEGLKDV